MSRRRDITFLLLLAAGLTGGCGVDDRPATWSYVSPAIFQPYCATSSCHGPAAAVSGLDFSTAHNGYVSLRILWTWVAVAPDAAAPSGTPCATVDGTLVCEEPLRPLVIPYDPAASRLINMLRARGAPRMPPDRPLTEPDIQLIERWILNGACEVGPPCALIVPTDGGIAERPAGGG